ncbi:MAG: UvrD-helicase domain-containing protein [Flavobacteriales bacterium]
MADIKNFYVLKSSAGSGKTYALVKFYLQLALGTKDHTYYKHILAITFTNAAAAEMKERVIMRLKEFSALPNPSAEPNQLFEEIKEKLAIPDHELRIRAEKTLVHMLHNYGLIGISTIDSFTHRIVRSFARDLRLHPDFTIEMDTAAFNERIVDTVLDQIGSNPELTTYLEKFALENFESEKSFKIRGNLEDVCYQLGNEESIAALKEIETMSLDDFERIRKQLLSLLRSFENKLEEPCKSAIAASEAAGLAITDYSYKSASAFSYFHKILGGTVESPGKRFRETVNKPNSWFAAKVPAAIKLKTDQVLPTLNDCAAEVLAIIDSPEFENYKIAEKAVNVVYSMGMLAKLALVARELKEEENLVLIQDFQKIISEIVNDNPAPFIYERVGERYNHILFDEFQDTSGLQWNNFLPLIENALSKGHFNLIVGDGKQAIYRWRNGKAEQFVKLPELLGDQLPERRQAIKYNYEKGLLKKNFRSSRAIIRFNNGLYKNYEEGGLLLLAKDVYLDQAQEEVKEIEGYVEVFINPEEKKLKTEQSLGYIVSTVQQCIADGYDPGDIAILTRKGGKDAGPISAALFQAGIQVVTKESFLLANSPKVKLVMAFLKYMTQPDHLYSRVSIWQNLCLIFPEKFNLRQLTETYSIRLEKQIIPDTILFFEKEYPNIGEVNMLLSAIEIAETTIRLFGLEKDVFLEFLCDHLTRLSTQKDYSLQEICEWWEDQREKLYISAQEGNDKVNIMTIHKSKGLQFPVVIYPRFSGKDNANEIWLDVDPEIFGLSKFIYKNSKTTIHEDMPHAVKQDIEMTTLDKLNLCYVATTRPEERLYILIEEKGADSISKEIMAQASKTMTASGSHYVIGEKSEPQRRRRQPQSVLLIDGQIKPNVHSAQLRYTVLKEKILEHQEQRLLGTIIHECLSYITLPVDIDQAIKKVMPRYPMFNSSQYPKLAQELLRICDHPSLRAWFSAGVKIFNEREIILPNGMPIRPDRVVIGENGWEVIDFKTGARSKKHLDQIRQYRDELEKISGQPTKGFLVYTDEMEIVPVF